MELTIEHLAPYLPYEISIEFKRNLHAKSSFTEILGPAHITALKFAKLHTIRPILYSLNVLDDEVEIDHNGVKIHAHDAFHQLCECEAEREFLDAIAGQNIQSMVGYWRFAPVSLFNLACSLHLDVFGLIGQGLAIEKK